MFTNKSLSICIETIIETRFASNEQNRIAICNYLFAGQIWTNTSFKSLCFFFLNGVFHKLI